MIQCVTHLVIHDTWAGFSNIIHILQLDLFILNRIYVSVGTKWLSSAGHMVEGKWFRRMVGVVVRYGRLHRQILWRWQIPACQRFGEDTKTTNWDTVSAIHWVVTLKVAVLFEIKQYKAMLLYMNMFLDLSYTHVYTYIRLCIYIPCMWSSVHLNTRDLFIRIINSVFSVLLIIYYSNGYVYSNI